MIAALGLIVKEVEMGTGDLGKLGVFTAIGIGANRILNLGPILIVGAVGLLVGIYLLYGTSRSFHNSKVEEMERGDVAEEPDVRVRLSEVEKAKHKSKIFPLLRDVGKLSLSTRDGDKYIMHGPDDHLRRVSEKVNA